MPTELQGWLRFERTVGLQGWPQFDLPSDTKLLLMKTFSEILSIFRNYEFHV